MGMLVPPAIFMIILGEVTNTSVVALFLAGFIPAAVVGLCLTVVVLCRRNLSTGRKTPNRACTFC